MLYIDVGITIVVAGTGAGRDEVEVVEHRVLEEDKSLSEEFRGERDLDRG